MITPPSSHRSHDAGGISGTLDGHVPERRHRDHSARTRRPELRPLQVADGGLAAPRDATLTVVRVQADPFAPPSRVRVTLPGAAPEELTTTADRRRALSGFLLRRLRRARARHPAARRRGRAGGPRAQRGPGRRGRHRDRRARGADARPEAAHPGPRGGDPARGDAPGRRRRPALGRLLRRRPPGRPRVRHHRRGRGRAAGRADGPGAGRVRRRRGRPAPPVRGRRPPAGGRDAVPLAGVVAGDDPDAQRGGRHRARRARRASR